MVMETIGAALNAGIWLFGAYALSQRLCGIVRDWLG